MRLRGSQLLQQIENSRCERPAIWWLGHSDFVLKYRRSIFYIDTYLSDSLGPNRPRLTEPPLRPDQITHASLVLCTHAHADHLDPGTVPTILEASRRAKVVIPKAIAEHGPEQQWIENRAGVIGEIDHQANRREIRAERDAAADGVGGWTPEDVSKQANRQGKATGHSDQCPALLDTGFTDR